VTTALAHRRFRRSARPRPRGVWIASGVGTVTVLVLAVGAWLPLTGFLAGVTATTAGFVPFPAVRVGVVTVLGVVVVLGFLVLAVTRRHAVTAWSAVVLAVLVGLAVTVSPVVTVAVASADRAGDVWPIITGLVSRFAG
jgi:hypothetical protein